MAIERKVKAATWGSAGGAVWGEAVLWLIDEYLIGPHVAGDVPEALQAALLAVAAAITAWVAGYRARHTPRPDLVQPVR